MTESMIERVARAIYTKNAAAAGGRQPWAKAREAVRENTRALARAALEEIRVPTPAMHAAGIKREVAWEYGECGDPDHGPHSSAAATYEAMIDAALKEETQ
jgi:hypothetical protein